MEPIKSNKKKRNSTLQISNTTKQLEKISIDKRKSSANDAVVSIDPNSLKSSILSLNLLSKKYDNYELPKFSNKQVGPLKSFSYNSYQGLYKDYNEDKIMICATIKKLVEMAYELGIDTLAEGVETKEQIQFLKEIGCASPDAPARRGETP